MRSGVIVALILITTAFAQKAVPPGPEPKSVTVPITIDHDRIVIEVELQLLDGTTKPIRGWVNPSGTHLRFSHRVAERAGLLFYEDPFTARPPKEMKIGGMTIPLGAIKQAYVSRNQSNYSAYLAGGMNVEIEIPSLVLRNYDVLIDFPEHRLTLAQPGSLKFTGVKTKAQFDPEHGLILIPSKIENKKYNFALDLGLPISVFSAELFDPLASAHPDWPHMTGAVGPAGTADVWGSSDEVGLKLMRVDRLQYGPLFLADVAVAARPKPSFLVAGANPPPTGQLGTEALQNYRIGLDYTHSVVYFEVGRTFNFPDFDVIGLILRPEDDGRFTILGIADFDGKASVPDGENGVHPGDHLVAVDGIIVAGSTTGQVWSMLGGLPGKERSLTIERGGKQFNVAAEVRHFLGENADDAAKKPEKN